MSIEGYLLNLLLVAAVVLQMRGKRLTPLGLLWPIALVVGAGVKYLGNVPTSGNDLPFLVAGGVTGALLGCLCAVFTRLRVDLHNTVIARASGLAAMFWVLGIGSRIVFELYAQNGGGADIARFSAEHRITGASAWSACLVLMALTEVVGRTALLAVRASRIPHVRSADAAAS